MDVKFLNPIRWASFALSILLPIIAWLQYYNWSFEGFSLLRLFGLLGIIAWLIMVSHFLVYALGLLTKEEVPKNKTYSTISSYTVLTLILLHPAIIYIRQFNIGQGLPPNSVDAYVGESLAIFITLGSVALVLFLAYEALEHFKERDFYKKYYLWILASQYVAMAFIFVHANKVGYITQTGWFAVIWWLCGLIVLATAFVAIPIAYKDH